MSRVPAERGFSGQLEASVAGRVKANAATTKRTSCGCVMNCVTCDRALIDRHDPAIRFDEATIKNGGMPLPPDGQRRPASYSAWPIQAGSTRKAFFRLSCRPNEGLMRVLLRLHGLKRPAPADHVPMSRWLRATEGRSKVPARLGVSGRRSPRRAALARSAMTKSARAGQGAPAA